MTFWAFITHSFKVILKFHLIVADTVKYSIIHSKLTTLNQLRLNCVTILASSQYLTDITTHHLHRMAVYLLRNAIYKF